MHKKMQKKVGRSSKKKKVCLGEVYVFEKLVLRRQTVNYIELFLMLKYLDLNSQVCSFILESDTKMP